MKKPPDQIRDEFVRQWSLKAEEDINAARSLMTHGEMFLSTVCFHAQQSAEKYLKAFLTSRQIEFRKRHDIGELLDLIAPLDSRLSEALRDAVVLTDYGVAVRYPGDFPNVTAADAQRAIQLAEEVRRLVLESL
jgi:HEPN domain-containing protein